MEHPLRLASAFDRLLSGDLSSPFSSSHLHHFLSGDPTVRPHRSKSKPFIFRRSTFNLKTSVTETKSALRWGGEMKPPVINFLYVSTLAFLANSISRGVAANPEINS